MNNNLTLREISDIIIDTFREFRQENERLIGSMEIVDRMFEDLRRGGFKLTAKQWDIVEQTVDVAGGQNLTMPGIREACNSLAAQMGFSAELNDAINMGYYGYIWVYSDGLAATIAHFSNMDDLEVTTHPDFAQYARLWGESMEEYVRRITLFVLCHERRHSQQQLDAIMADYDGVTPENLIDVHDQLACEIDANNYATYHTLNENGMYYGAY